MAYKIDNLLRKSDRLINKLFRSAGFVRAKIKHIDKLTTLEYFRHPIRYAGLADGLLQLPVPDKIKIGRKYYDVPKDVRELTQEISYGQRYFLTEEITQTNEIIFRFVVCYFYPIVTKKIFDEKKAFKFGSKVLHSPIKQVYPVAYHLVNLFGELAENERKALQRKPSKQEKAAGIEKLAKFSDLIALNFLIQVFNCSEEAVMQKPYADCLVRFMHKKEEGEYIDRLQEVYRKEQEQKNNKFKLKK